MVIKVRDIPENGLCFTIKDDRKSLPLGKRKIPIAEGFSGFLEVTKRDDGRVIVEGSFNVVLKLTCSRCLEPFDFTVTESFKDVFFPSSLCFHHGVHELSREELEVLYYSHGEIDLSLIYLEKTYLAIPMKPLCSEDCKGICPICGKNLNYGECGCNRRSTDPRWQKLAEIKEKLLKG